MNTMKAVFKDTPVEEVSKLREQAMHLGRTTSKSARDAANAQVELARSGMEVQEVYEAVPHVLDLAIAGEMSMAEAAGLVTNQLKSFKLGTEETQRVVDVLVKTANSAKTTVSELGPAFRQVAPLAAGLGISIEQTAAMLGTLRDQGLIAEQAGTGLRNIISVFQEEPSDKIRRGFEDLGLEFADIQKMVEIGDLEGALKLMGDAGLNTKTALAVFGRESAVAATILAGTATGVEDFIEQLKAAGDTAEEVREIMESGLPGAAAQFSSALEGLQLALGESGLTGAITWILTKLRDFLTMLSEGPPWLRQLMSGALVAGPVLLVMGAALKAVSFALGGLMPMVNFFNNTLLPKTHHVLRILRVALLRSVIPSLRLFAVTLWTKGVAALRVFWQRLVAASAATFSFARRSIAAGIAGVVSFAATIWASAIPALGAFAAGVWATTVALLANPITWVVAGIVALIAALVAAVVWWDEIKAAIVGVWEWLRDTELFGPLIEGVEAAMSWIYDTVVAGIEKVTRWLTDNPVVAGISWLGDKLGLDADTRKGLTAFGTPAGAGGVPALDSGGIVSRPTLAALAMNSQPEAILPLDQLGGFLRDLGEMTAQAMAPPLIGPVMTPALASAAAGPVTVTKHYSFHWDALNVSVEHGDPDEIAATVGRALEQQLHNVVEDFDDDVER